MLFVGAVEVNALSQGALQRFTPNLPVGRRTCYNWGNRHPINSKIWKRPTNHRFMLKTLHPGTPERSGIPLPDHSLRRQRDQGAFL